jgi:hypothetical protein
MIFATSLKTVTQSAPSNLGRTKQSIKRFKGFCFLLIQCGLCHWPKCEHDYVITPSVNSTLRIELNGEKYFRIQN